MQPTVSRGEEAFDLLVTLGREGHIILQFFIKDKTICWNREKVNQER